MAKNNTEKNKDYILFLERVLDVCCELAKRTQEDKYRQLEFSTDYIDEYYKIGDRGWGNRLVFCIHNALKNSSNRLKIRAFLEEKIDYINILNTVPSILEDTLDRREESIDKQISNMKNHFVNEKFVENLKQTSADFLDINKRLVNTKNIFYLTDSDIEEYLSAYYVLLSRFIIEDDIYRDSAEKKEFIKELLLLDAEYDEEMDNYIFNFSAPIIMNRIQKVNRGIEEFYNIILKQEEDSKVPLQLLYKRILLTKVKHMFRWYTTGQKGELYHAAIANYVEAENNYWKFKVVAKNINSYNSFEGIGELRLAEKIVYEFNLKKGEEFKVAIAGDIWTEPIEELYTYVYKKIKSVVENVQLKFSIYTKNKLGTLENCNIKYCGETKDILQNRDALQKVIKGHNVLFLLDCIELYQISEHVETNKIDYYRQRFSFNQYKDKSLGLKEYMDVSDSNMLDELYEDMTVFCRYNYMGKLQKQANETLLSFCEKECKEEGTVAYIYVSDLTAFKKIYNDYRYYIRTEKYNEKEVGIIRYSNETTVFLENGSSCMIVFSIWQFLKHVAIEEKEKLIENLIDNTYNLGYEILSDILIGIDYSKWRNFINIHYYAERGKANGKKADTEMQQIAENFIKKILLPILNCEERNMFNVYIEKAMCSFFYSTAKNVEDMLFLHLFEKERDKIGKAQIAEVNDPKKVKNNKDETFKYSLKRFYSLITTNYDVSATDSVEQFKTLQIIQNNAMSNPMINKKGIYRNVIEACKKIGYQESYLEQNCIRKISD